MLKKSPKIIKMSEKGDTHNVNVLIAQKLFRLIGYFQRFYTWL